MGYDAVVVGGGLIGAACADALAGEGMKVCLLEAGPFVRESSWAGAGILHPIHPWSYAEPLQALLRAGVAEHERAAPGLWARTGIDPEYERSGLLLMGDDRDRLASWLGDGSGAVEVRASGDDPAIRLDRPALLLPAACHVKSHRLAEAYLPSAKARGADLFECRPVTALRPGAAETPGGTVKAGLTVLCAGAWSGRLRPGLLTEPVRGQILLYRGRARRMAIFPDGEYVVPRRGGLLLFGSTLEHAGFDPRPTADHCARLAGRARDLLGLDESELLAAWAGLRPGTSNALPYIGRDPARPDLLHASGHYRNGILLAPLTARAVADLAAGREPDYDLTAFRPPAPPL